MKENLINKVILCVAFMLAGFATSAQQLVMPGDHPDPSVVKIGNRYWASATSSNWAPAFPLMTSKNLTDWKTAGYVFDSLPSWADFYFWAPEITYENGKVFLYYAAHKKGGNLCIAVASADKPEGPYTDHGPLMCEAAGSIDAFPMRDENGKLYMIWKEDGNSVKKPTPIWAMEMNEGRTALVGTKTMLFQNDQPWERNLVEGVSMVKHGEWFYAFYAAAGCCGAGCDYVTAVARSKKLLGPWEKYDKNPLLGNGNDWVCPGHGTPVEKDGRFYFLFHGYNKQTNTATGREGLLIEYRVTDDGWIEFIKNNNTAKSKSSDLKEKFNGDILGTQWQTSVFQKTDRQLSDGKLILSALPEPSGRFVGTPITGGDYTATVKVLTNQSGAASAISAIGDEKNILSLFYNKGILSLVELKRGKENIITTKTISATEKVWLRLQSSEGTRFSFFYSTNGKKFISINEQPVEGKFLPPWDRAVRVCVAAKGEEGNKAVFDDFEIKYSSPAAENMLKK